MSAHGSMEELAAALEDCPALRDFLAVALAAVPPGEALPKKEKLDVARMSRAGVLPFVWIIELGEDRVFRYRLVGEEVRRGFGVPMRGRTVEDVLGVEAAAAPLAIFGTVLAERLIHWSAGQVTRGGRAFYQGRRILLPLREGGGEARLVIGCFVRQAFNELQLRGPNISFEVARLITVPLSGGDARGRPGHAGPSRAGTLS